MAEKRPLTSGGTAEDGTFSSYRSIQHNDSDSTLYSVHPLPHHRDGEIKVYKRRWWIIAVFAAVSLTQVCIHIRTGPYITHWKKV